MRRNLFGRTRLEVLALITLRYPLQAVAAALPLWHMESGWKGRVWYAVASRLWWVWEASEGRA
jgi:hypothetical protein